MTQTSPLASIIIPTHNRARLLERTLLALARQTSPAQDYEVILVADGCNDETVQVARQFDSPYRLQLVEQPQQGPAAARNRGAQVAAGELLIFIDDDIEVVPHFVAAHLDAHTGSENLVVIGYLQPVLQPQRGFFRAELMIWWENMFERLREPGHRFSYQDLTSGNFSLRKELFVSVSGFDTDFRCHEDYELGFRLLQAGARMTFSMQAAGFHHENTMLDGSLQRKYQEGVADTLLGERYPQLQPTFLMAHLQQYARLPSRMLQFMAFHWPATSERLARWLPRLLVVFERFHWYAGWRRLLDGLLAYWYWRGVMQRLTSPKAVKQYLSAVPLGSPAEHEKLEIDLSGGIAQAERILDMRSPEAVKLRYRQIYIGSLPDQPGAEKLRSAHLRPALATTFAIPLLRALALNGSVGDPEIAGRLEAECEQVMKDNPRYAEPLD
ncbi:MAG: glycosyltransferase family 2 protein [Anaerolineales bacterium]|jgi:glycosyltransferase involved in cell wall biosynthesis